MGLPVVYHHTEIRIGRDRLQPVHTIMFLLFSTVDEPNSCSRFSSVHEPTKLFLRVVLKEHRAVIHRATKSYPESCTHLFAY